MMENKLNTQPNMTDPDAFYASLTSAHRDLDPEQSERLNARLILLLSNHIGDTGVLSEALNIASDLSLSDDE